MKYVFDTVDRTRYTFPTHINDLVIDRAEAAASEVFVVIIEPGKATHLHRHDDVEQVFYILKGKGVLYIGRDKKKFLVKPAQVVKIPPKTLHTVRAQGKKALRYLCIDCFCPHRRNNEPTWEAHVRGICREQGYDFADVIKAPKSGRNRKWP
jgi:mannose-6-phosphate isomerase-like protein (cupin superfamily)